ncbi:hypothetical protein QL285_075326 [Trifolium repens]|nr:hypothetical protein QL285_075326 [Trifolium repens]
MVITIDFHANKVLAAAAQISANTLTRAATAIRLDAERRAMIAVGARKRAVEALELFADLVAKEQEAASTSSEQEDDSVQLFIKLQRRRMWKSSRLIHT